MVIMPKLPGVAFIGKSTGADSPSATVVVGTGPAAEPGPINCHVAPSHIRITEPSHHCVPADGLPGGVDEMITEPVPVPPPPSPMIEPLVVLTQTAPSNSAST